MQFAKILSGLINKASNSNMGAGKTNYWIGLRVDQPQRAEGGKWTDGSALDYGKPQSGAKGKKGAGEPNNINQEGEGCTMLYGWSTAAGSGPAGSGVVNTGEWNDLRCDRAKADYWDKAKAGFVCMKMVGK